MELDSFKSVFIALTIAGALVVGAFFIQAQRPDVATEQPSPELVKATGKCASCHRQETAAIVEEYERSEHVKEGTTCLDCHRPQDGQESFDHRGFTLATSLTAKNCSQCHAEENRQFLRSRHAAPAWAAVRGSTDFTQEQIEFAETYHEGAVARPPNRLAQLEGEAATEVGCQGCHNIGKPNPDGSIGSCTQCHGRHEASVELAREPRTCGQCHMGPDHAQIEIFEESKHGVLFETNGDDYNMDAEPEELTVSDMPSPTCTTCHMSGQEGLPVTHNVSERLSWYLFAPVSEKRPNYAQNQVEMKRACNNCHTAEHTNEYYEDAERVVRATNEKVNNYMSIVDSLRAEGHLTPTPFDESLEFEIFDYWHYYGRTAKHGAFMGGPDYVQWHGNYELLARFVHLKEKAKELRSDGSSD
jgi:nitrate/TMAO reductase-like tetraheme cytochrome c subunit